jgi:hypothetical protein
MTDKENKELQNIKSIAQMLIEAVEKIEVKPVIKKRDVEFERYKLRRMKTRLQK